MDDVRPGGELQLHHEFSWLAKELQSQNGFSGAAEKALQSFRAAEKPESIDSGFTGYVKEHPVESGALAIGLLTAVGVAAKLAAGAAARGVESKALSAADQGLAKAGDSLFSKDGTFRAGAGVLKTIDGAPIPDLERPFLQGSTLQQQLIDKGRESYAGDLVKLWTMPSTAEAHAGESLGKFAERTLKERAALTGERINPDAITKEADRLLKLNEGLTLEADLSGKTLVTRDAGALQKQAEELQFKHVPQLGQFLKGTGKISEEQIEEALKIQRALPADGPRKLIGEILVENRLATKADVDAAFANQQELKNALKSVREKFLSNVGEKK